MNIPYGKMMLEAELDRLCGLLRNVCDEAVRDQLVEAITRVARAIEAPRVPPVLGQ